MANLLVHHYMFIISQLWLTSHPRSTVVLLNTGTPGTSREIHNEDANDFLMLLVHVMNHDTLLWKQLLVITISHGRLHIYSKSMSVGLTWLKLLSNS